MILFNGSPVELTGQYASRTYIFPPHKKVQIKSYKSRHEAINSDSIGNKLIQDLAESGLILVDEVDPQSPKEMIEEGGKRFVKWVKKNIKSLNDLNLDLAATQRGTVRVSEQLKMLREEMVKLSGTPERDVDLLSDAALEKVTRKATANLMDTMQRARAALETGDPDAAAAILEGKDAIVAGTATVADEIEADTETEFVEPSRPLGRGGRRKTK